MSRFSMDSTALTEMKFEVALAELETIVRTMENGALELDEAITAYKRGAALLHHCRDQLAAAENQLGMLEESPMLSTSPLNATPTEGKQA